MIHINKKSTFCYWILVNHDLYIIVWYIDYVNQYVKITSNELPKFNTDNIISIKHCNYFFYFRDTVVLNNTNISAITKNGNIIELNLDTVHQATYISKVDDKITYPRFQHIYSSNEHRHGLKKKKKKIQVVLDLGPVGHCPFKGKPLPARMRSLCLVFSNLRNSLASLAELANPSPPVSLLFVVVVVVVVFWARRRSFIHTGKDGRPSAPSCLPKSMPEKRPVIPVGTREEFGAANTGESRRLGSPPSLSRQQRIAFQFSHITPHPCWLRQLSHWANLHNLTSPLCSCVDRGKANPAQLPADVDPRKMVVGFSFTARPSPTVSSGRSCLVSGAWMCWINAAVSPPPGEKGSTVNKLRMLTRRCCGGVFFRCLYHLTG